MHKEERSNIAFPDYKAKSCYFLGYLEESPKSFVVKDTKSGRVLVRDSCVFDPDLNKFSKNVLDTIDEDDAEDEVKDDDQLVQIDDVPDPILSRLQDLRISTQNKHEKTEKLAAEKSLVKRLHRKSPANSLSISSINFANDDYVPYVRLFNVKYGSITKRPLLSNRKVWLCKINEVLPLKLPPEPKTFDEAIAPDNPYKDQWWEAILKECQVLTDFGCFRVAEEQTGRTMKTKWVFKVMMKNDMTYKFKARLVVCGYSQVYAIFDVTAAFLEETNDFKQYCWLPKELGLDGINKLRVEIIKALYGEKQAPKIWSDLLHSILTKMGFHRCDVVPCLYIRGTPDSDDYMVVCVHVDDGYIVSKSEGAIDTFIIDLMKEIHNATLYKPCQKYVGMEIIPDGNHVLVHQNTYIKSLKLLDITDDCHSEETPMSNTMDLKDSKVNPPNPQISSLLPVTGFLRYIADRTRPDVLVAVGEIFRTTN